jgi:hypothetical protein
MSDPNWIFAANAHYSESVLSKIRTDSGVEASSRSTHFCRTVKQTVKTLPNATANDIWLGAGCDAATRPQCSPTASHRLTATLVGARALMFTAVRAGRPHPRGFRFARHPDSGSGTEKQTSEAAMVERRDRAPIRPPAGRKRANQFGAQIYCDTLRHLSLWVCRGFELDQLAEASSVRRQAPRFYRVADWRQRRRGCGLTR